MNVRVAALVTTLVVACAGCTRTPVLDTNVAKDQVLAWPLAADQTASFNSAKVVTDNGTTLDLVLADTITERQKGLSERDEMPQDGMLFVIDPISQTDIWMRGMRFDLDIVWLSKGRVMYTETNVRAAEPGDEHPPSYGPGLPVDAVIEVASGSSARYGLIKGAWVDIQALH